MLKKKSIPTLASKGKMEGITLIEVVITTAIVAILAAVAVPSFQQQMYQSKRSDAHHLLRVNESRLTKCLTLAGSYDSDCNLVLISKEGLYSLTTNLTTQTWTITATPIATESQANDTDCTSFSLSHIGQKTATGDGGANCW